MKNKGITLIALIITIIVLLILAGISLSMLAGDNSVLQRAAEAKEQTRTSEIQEKIQLEIMGSIETTGKVNETQAIANIQRNIEGAKVSGSSFPCTVNINGDKYNIDENGKVEVYKPITNPHEGEEWVKAWVCNDGVWNDTPIEAGNPAEGDVVAKLYKTGNRFTPSAEFLNENYSGNTLSFAFEEGNEYELVFEGNGKVGKLLEKEDDFKYSELCAYELSSLSKQMPEARERVNNWQTNYYNELINSGMNQMEAYYSVMNSLTTEIIGLDLTENGALTSYITKVTVCEGITELGTGMMCYFTSLINVLLPSTLTKLGDVAFEECRSLSNVKIPSEVIQIGNYTFFYCDNLTNITIPNRVRNIGKKAFSACYALESVTIPNSVIGIGEGAFGACNGLTNVTISSSITEIEGSTFGGCTSLINIVIPHGVTKIGYMAFNNCRSLKSVTIPNSVIEIEEGAFYWCNDLDNVLIPNNVEQIGKDAFRRVKHIIYEGTATGAKWGATAMN